MIEGALAAEAEVLRCFVAAQLRVHGGTRGRYVVPAALAAALPRAPTLNIPVSTRASSKLRGEALPPQAPPRVLQVPAPGQTLRLAVPAVATAPVGRAHVAPPPASREGEEKKGEEPEPPAPAPPPPLPPPLTTAQIRAAVGAAEAERLAALAATGLLPPAPPLKLRLSPSRPLAPARVAAAAATTAPPGPPFSLPPLPPPPRAGTYPTPGAALEAALAVESPGALLEVYVAAGAPAAAPLRARPPRPASASSELLSAVASNVSGNVDNMGVPVIGEVGDRRALAGGGSSGAAPRPPPYALRATPLTAAFGDVRADGKEVVLELLLANVGGAGREPIRFRVADRALLAPHARAGNSVRVRHDGGPLAL